MKGKGFGMQEHINSRPEFWKNPITLALATLILFFTSQLMGALLVTPFMRYIPGQNLQLLTYIGANTISLSVLLVIAQRIFRFQWRSFGLKACGLKGILPVFPAFFLYFMISIGFTLLASKFIPGFNVEQAQETGFSKGNSPIELIAAFISLVLITPLFEEAIFRGVLFHGLRKKLPFWFAALITSVVFALAHGQWNVGIDTFALSLILCYLVEKSGSIIPALLLHGLKNSVAFVLLFIVRV